MDSWRGGGRDEGSAADPHTDRGDRTDRADRTSRPEAASPDTHAGEGTWAPAESGGRMVSLDEEQFEALVRPLRDG
jgi:hypothetical protein